MTDPAVNKHLDAYISGAAQSTPGLAGIGLVLRSANADPSELSEPIGITTVEQANYQAVVRALNIAIETSCDSLSVYSDNAALVETLSHGLLVTNPDIEGLHGQIQQLSRSIAATYHLASAEQISRSQELATQASLDDSPARSECNDDGQTLDRRKAIQQSAGGVLYKKEGGRIQVCLISKRDGQLWALPKGRVNPGESWEQAAIREVLEETGHLATISDHIDKIDYFFYWKGNRTLYYKIVSFFLMPLVTEDFAERDTEADDVAWFSLGEAWRRLYYQSEKDILRQAKHILKVAGL